MWLLWHDLFLERVFVFPQKEISKIKICWWNSKKIIFGIIRWSEIIWAFQIYLAIKMMPVSKYFQHVGQKKIQNLIGNKSVNAELHKSDPELSSKMWISEHQYKTSVPAIDTITLKDLKATFCHCITISLVYRVSQKEVSCQIFRFWT